MQRKIKQLWTLINLSQIAKSQFIFLFFISIVEVVAGLTVPLLTMKLINQISSSGFAFSSLLPVIGVAHRLSTIINADQILVFEEGRLSGQGTHEALLATHSYYQQLWHNGHLA